VKNKMVFGLGELPMTLTQMITHGHGDKAFAQYFNELWLNYTNFKIGSLVQLFRSLEKEPIRESWVLFELNPKMHSSNKSCKEVLVV